MSQNKIEKWDEINGNTSPFEKMEAFLDHAGDGYAILQLRQIPETRYESFASMRMLERMDITPDISHYEVVYTAPLPPFSDRNTMLEDLYTKFNIDRPADFKGHSLSVSDIVALKVNGEVSSHYVDSIGFAELPDFIRRENHLKNAEMSMEDDYNSIDGIVGNNGRSPALREQYGEEEKRPSVLEQLKNDFKPPEESRNQRPKHREERGLE